MAANAKPPATLFDPTAFDSFRFLERDLDARGHVTLRYALDEDIFFVEELDLPVELEGSREASPEEVQGLLALLHWVAGVSYFKTALPQECELRERRSPAGDGGVAGGAVLRGPGRAGLHEPPPRPTAPEVRRRGVADSHEPVGGDERAPGKRAAGARPAACAGADRRGQGLGGGARDRQALGM